MTTYADDNSGGGTGLAATMRATAIAAAGINASRLVDCLEPFWGFNTRYSGGASGGGTANLTATPLVGEGPGSALLTTGAAGASLVFANDNARILNDLRAAPWYLAWRGAFSALDAAAGGGVGFGSALGVDLLIGYIGSISTVNWVLPTGGAALPGGTGVVIPGTTVDTNVHLFEMWMPNATTVFGRVDGGATVSAAWAGGANFVGANLNGKLAIHNGGTAAARTLQVCWVYSAAA